MIDVQSIDFQKLAASVSLETIQRNSNPGLWEKSLQQASYAPHQYLGSSLDYQFEYFSANGGVWEDRSVLIQAAGQVIGLWPLTISKVDAVTRISSQGQDIMPPLFLASAPDTTKKKAVKKCYDFLGLLSQQIGNAEFRTVESFCENSGLSNWHMEGMRRGASFEMRHELYLNTQNSPDEIFGSFKDKLRNTIKQASKLWAYTILSNADEGREAVWNEFKELHFSVAGRKTRSEQSWQLQLDAIAGGHAILIYLRDVDKKMIGGGFFELSKDEANYSVGAYDRSLFDKPIGHLVQWAAIQEFIKRKIRWYKIGYCPFPVDSPAPSDKEMSISEFKKGFASHVFPKFILKHPATTPQADAT